MIANYYGFGLEEYDRLTPAQRSALSQAFGVLNRAGLESTGFRVAGPTPPTWQPGDVVVVRFRAETSHPFTYVRGSHAWPGDRRAPKTDAEISELFRIGKAVHVMRNGRPVLSDSQVTALYDACAKEEEVAFRMKFTPSLPTAEIRRILTGLTPNTEASS